MNNTLLISAAGSGKTTFLIKKALECKNTVLITTYTEENEKEIRKKFLDLNNGIIPGNIVIKTWFSLLIEHGAKPYQGTLTNKNITGLLLVEGQSGLKYKTSKYPVYYKKEEVDNYYFSENYSIYSDKLAEFVIECNKESKGLVIQRFSRIFGNIFIDEIQDMAGYDLEIIKLLFSTSSVVKIVGDPRQVTYYTHFSKKYSKYKNGQIINFVEKECKKNICEIDAKTLNGSWRNNEAICKFSSSLFTEYGVTQSLQMVVTGHDGIFLVREKDMDSYLEKYNPMQLRYDRKNKKINPKYRVKNFGESKGATYDRVVIYPTKAIIDFILLGKPISDFGTKCKFYVALTRAKYSVAIVCKDDDVIDMTKFSIYSRE